MQNRGVIIAAKWYSLVQWNWFSVVTGCTWVTCITDVREPISLHQAVDTVQTVSASKSEGVWSWVARNRRGRTQGKTACLWNWGRRVMGKKVTRAKKTGSRRKCQVHMFFVGIIFFHFSMTGCPTLVLEWLSLNLRRVSCCALSWLVTSATMKQSHLTAEKPKLIRWEHWLNTRTYLLWLIDKFRGRGGGGLVKTKCMRIMVRWLCVREYVVERLLIKSAILELTNFNFSFCHVQLTSRWQCKWIVKLKLLCLWDWWSKTKSAIFWLPQVFSKGGDEPYCSHYLDRNALLSHIPWMRWTFFWRKLFSCCDWKAIKIKRYALWTFGVTLIREAHGQSVREAHGQSVTASDFGSNGPRFESGRGRCVESLEKALYSHCPKEKPSH